MKKILIIEDDQALYNVYSTELKLQGYDLSNVSDGMKAVEAVRTTMPDLVLLDIMLPGKNGLEILQEIKADGDLANTRIVMLTNYGSDENVRKALDAGAAGYMLKYNIIPSELSQKVSEFLGESENSAVNITSES